MFYKYKTLDYWTSCFLFTWLYHQFSELPRRVIAEISLIVDRISSEVNELKRRAITHLCSFAQKFRMKNKTTEAANENKLVEHVSTDESNFDSCYHRSRILCYKNIFKNASFTWKASNKANVLDEITHFYSHIKYKHYHLPLTPMCCSFRFGKKSGHCCLLPKAFWKA